MAYPDEKGLTYEIVQSLGRKDKLIKLKSNPQARKKWPELEQEVVVRLITRVKDGK
ncbi:hypothetical protein VspSTUT16_36530 [Vibrio sp. STUT-A16]|nr:hypothetical protein VspSTUT16_36530 [Vibrio sp. STUT-A16]